MIGVSFENFLRKLMHELSFIFESSITALWKCCGDRVEY